MKIAIYGDSFADYKPYTTSAQRSVIESAWSYQLALHHNVRNYSLSGSSLYWRMKQFEPSYSWADRVIFIVTTAGRYPGHWLDSQGLVHTISSAEQAHDQLTSQGSQLDTHSQRQIQAVRDWYMWARVDEFEIYAHDLMTARIRTLRPDAIIIPINPYGNASLSHLVTTTDYIIRGFRSWQAPSDTPWTYDDYSQLYQQYEELRCVCHFTQQVNQVFLEDIIQALDTGQWAPSLPDSIPHPEPRDYYYKQR